MNEKKARIKGARRVNAMAMRPALRLGDLFRRMAEAMRRVFTRPASESWDAADEKPAATPMGIRFRQRR